jgi:hypothetical protein
MDYCFRSAGNAKGQSVKRIEHGARVINIQEAIPVFPGSELEL